MSVCHFTTINLTTSFGHDELFSFYTQKRKSGASNKSRTMIKTEQLTVPGKNVLLRNTGLVWGNFKAWRVFHLISSFSCWMSYITKHFRAAFPGFYPCDSAVRQNIILYSWQFALAGEDCRSLCKFAMFSKQCLNNSRNNLANKASFFFLTKMVIADSFSSSQIFV